ncbi:TPA: hypothetical protein OOF39_000045 [Kluyvera ascorbata]|nr:hypothetical protein [Kluyvera ascorbata]
MLVSVSGNGLKLIESGIFHLEVNGDSGHELKFNWGNLRIIINTSIIGDKDETTEGINVDVKDNVIVFNHVTKKPSPWVPLGLAIPSEIGAKNDGKKIYFSWSTNVTHLGSDRYVLVINYSFYEDE